MAITISVALQKGGSGKSTTAEAVAAILGHKGKRVLMVDMDPQGNTTFVSGINPDKTITDTFTGDVPTERAIYHSTNYDILASDEFLANLESINDVESTLLKNTLAAVADKYDYILIDTPPSIGNLLKNSLMASDYVLIPLEASPFAVKGLEDLAPTINAVRAVSRRLKTLGVVLIKFNERTILNRQIKDLLMDRVQSLDTELFNTKIRNSIAVSEAQAAQMSLIDYAPKNNACIDYINLTDEIIRKVER